ncbi:MAG: CPBP family intramembrane metalloprotease [Bacteroidales bacterium]|nr:CPBP family intramembrane metalloprotease [Bacteroidales bacterium]
MNTKKLIVFLLLAFLPMVAVGLVMHFSGASAGEAVANAASGDPLTAIKRLVMSAGSMLIPLLAVIFTQIIFKEPVLKGLGISFKVNRWWWIGWLLMPVIAMVTLGVTLLMPGAKWTPDSDMVQQSLQSLPDGVGVWGLIGITLLSGLFAGVTINAVFAFGEEIAWRGFLMKEFKVKKFLSAALWIGVIWGFWHAPLILNGHNYPQHPVAGVFMMVLLCILLTTMLMYFLKKSGSVIVAAIMHGTINAVSGITAIVVTPANDLLYGAAGAAGMIVLLVVDVCLFLYDRFVSRENLFTKAL